MSRVISLLLFCPAVLICLCFTSALVSLISLSLHESSSWAATAPAPSSSRWQSRPTGSPLARWQGVRVTPHWLPAYLHPTTTRPPTCLCAYLPPPALCCPHKKRVRERERTMAPLLPFSLLTRATVAPLLKEKCSLSFSLNLSLSLIHPSVSLCPVSPLSACHGKTLLCGFFCTCVSDQKREDEGGGEGRCLCLVFGFRLPTVFLLLLLQPSFIPPFSSSFYPKGDSLIRRYGSTIPSSLSVSL